MQTEQILSFLHKLRNFGKLKEFLFQVPLKDLHQAVQDKQLRANISSNYSREPYRKNVLDMTLEEVMRRCHLEKIIYRFGQKYVRIQDHPRYGRKLARRFPDKYFIGERSGHYNKSRQIQKAYGIKAKQENEENNSQQEVKEQDEDQYEEYYLLEEDQEPANVQIIQQNGKNDKKSFNENSDDGFIVSDDDSLKGESSLDSFQEESLHQKSSKIERWYDESEKMGFYRTSKKSKNKHRYTKRKPKRYVSEESQQISPEQTQKEILKRELKQIKKQRKRLQSIVVKVPALSSSTNCFAEDQNHKGRQTQNDSEGELIVPRRSNKMLLSFD